MSNERKLTASAGAPDDRRPERDHRRAARLLLLQDVWFLPERAAQSS
jgi:hypothetical protein